VIAMRTTRTRLADPLDRGSMLGSSAGSSQGGLAAVALIILGAVVLADETLEGLDADADSTLTIAWALVIGAASPAVWRALRKIVYARVGPVRRDYERDLAAGEQQNEANKKGQQKALNDARDARIKAKAKRDANRRSRERRIVPVPADELRNRMRLAFAAEPGQIEINDATTEALDELIIDQLDPSSAVEAEEEEIEALDRAIGALELLQSQQEP
jgi:hypothetical protein